MNPTERKLYMEQVEQQRKEAEFEFRQQVFATGDTDGDGMLSQDELQAAAVVLKLAVQWA